jgi:hypothetical protein
MEHRESVITSVDIMNTYIRVHYDNDEIEIIPINRESYSKMREEWLINQPPFISDKYKINMNNIIMACIVKKQSAINELNTFFSEGNEENIKNFFTYMRNRDLAYEKSRWNKI